VSGRGVDQKALAGKFRPPERRVEILVVGAGLAGVTAATAAARSGAQVLLVDENPVPPGLMGLDAPHVFGGCFTGAAGAPGRMVERLFSARPGLETAFEAGVEIELGVNCWGAWTPGPGLLSLPGPLAGLADETRAWTVGFERLILATGARDVMFAFPGWDQPGVLGAQALGALIDDYDALAARRLAILGSGDLALSAAKLALDKGLEVAALIEIEDRVHGDAGAAAALRAGGVEVLTGYAPVRVEGGAGGVERLVIRPVAGGAQRTLSCEAVVQAIGVTPAAELLDVLGGAMVMDPARGGFAPATTDGIGVSVPTVYLAGEVAGCPGGQSLPASEAMASGLRAACAALASLGRTPPPAPPSPPWVATRDAMAYRAAWMRALASLDPGDTPICQCEGVTRSDLVGLRPPAYLGPPTARQAGRDLAALLRDGPLDADQVKRLTRAGMGACQGRRCREQAALILAHAAGLSPEAQPRAAWRAPVRPLPLSVLADEAETPLMSGLWDVWFGIPGQWVPYDQIGTEREAQYSGLFGEAAPP
jgi:thioredoxin reductase